LKFKRKRLNSFINRLLLITCIAVVSFMGVGYAAWNSNVEITTSISTAKVNPIFCGKYNFKKIHGSSNPLITFSEKKDAMLITGDITMEGSIENGNNIPGYKALLHYCIKNDATVPIKFIGSNGTIQVKINGSNKTLPVKIKDNEDNASLEYEIEIPAEDGEGKFKLTLNQQSGILKGGDSFYSETGNPKLQIEATKPGDYKFEIELPFILWNGSAEDNKTWKKTLIIKGDITVMEATN
jgi:hypothetical protein